MDLVARVLPALVAALAAAASAAADLVRYCGTKQWQPFVTEAADRFDVPPSWLHAVMGAESAGCAQLNGRPATSTAGAMGLMQLMPQTWAEYRTRLTLGDDPHDPRDNILAGAAYLRNLYDTYGHPGLFAAYHAGPTRYEDHLNNSRPLPQATLDYLARVQGEGAPTQHTTASKPEARTVFVTRERDSATSDEASPERPTRSLFVRLSSTRRRLDRDPREQSDVQSE